QDITHWWRRAATSLVVMSAVVFPAWAAPGDKTKASPPSAKKAKGKNAQKKANREHKAPQPSGIQPPARPAKVVTAPTLTHEGLDALVEKYLESAKVPVATATTDVEFVRRITLDLTGKL